MQSIIQMTARQQTMVMNLVEIGKKWIAEEIAYEQVKQILGQPDHYYDTPDYWFIDATYFPDKVMLVTFRWKKEKSGEKKITSFQIDIEQNIHNHIPYEKFDRLGFKRFENGKLTPDKTRTEGSDFFVPEGIITKAFDPFDPLTPENYVKFNYYLPLPADSLFDIYMTIGYLGKWAVEKGPWTLDNFRDAVDFRALEIGRYYLTPEELQHRELMKRQKYGEMRLHTGMICPETGIWEGWSPNGPTTQMKIAAGQSFPEVRAIAPDVQWYTPFVAGTWMWLKKDFS